MSRGSGGSGESVYRADMSRRPDAIECLLIAALVATTLLMGAATVLLTGSLLA